MSDTVIEWVRLNTPMTFEDFMRQMLYHRDFGYYVSHQEKFGQLGDFTTAPEMTSLFADALARQCIELFDIIGQRKLFEFGAGSGALCVALFRYLAEHNRLPECYYILDVSGDLRARQSEYILSTIPQWHDRVFWLDAWPDESLEGVMLANEVLDAMPFKRFKRDENGIHEQWVEWTEDGLMATYPTLSDEPWAESLCDHIPQGIPYVSEYQAWIPGWMKECSRILKTGALIILDYGFPRHEYYHPDRHQGTLMCHYRHQSHTDPFIHLAQQDITAHVDFTQVAECAQQAGFTIDGYTTQASFLINCGILDDLAKMPEGVARMNATQAVKQLLQPHEMGELFKVMALGKGLNHDWRGFVWGDRRESL